MKALPIAAALAAAILIVGMMFFAFTKPPPYPIPEAMTNVTLPRANPYGQLTTGSWDDRSPVWSPNGSLIAFVSNREGSWGLWVMRPDGSEQERLTSRGVTVSSPSWSPDSSSIAFWCLDGGRACHEIMHLSDLSTVRIPDGGFIEPRAEAKWSPDGSRLLYYRMAPALQLVCFDLASVSTKVLAEVNGSDLTADWAAKDQVVYSNLDGGRYEIRWLNLTSGEGGILLKGDSNYRGPSISPDGTRIAYYSDATIRNSLNILPFSGYNVWVAQLNGLNAIYLYERMGESTRYRPGEVVVANPLQWSPDGKLVACVLNSPLFGRGLYVWNYDLKTVREWGLPKGRRQSPRGALTARRLPSAATLLATITYGCKSFPERGASAHRPIDEPASC